MTTISAAAARTSLLSILDEVSETHEPVKISGRKRSGVLVSADDWRAIQETLYLVSIPGMRESIIEGMKTPVSKCAGTPGW